MCYAANTKNKPVTIEIQKYLDYILETIPYKRMYRSKQRQTRVAINIVRSKAEEVVSELNSTIPSRN